MFEKYLNNRSLTLFIIPFILGSLCVFSFQPFNYTIINNLAGKNRNGYLGVFTNSAANFKIVPPAGGDCKNGPGQHVQKTAVANKCMFATNGGPFNYPGPFGTSTGCSGVLISDSKTLANDYKNGVWSRRR